MVCFAPDVGWGTERRFLSESVEGLRSSALGLPLPSTRIRFLMIYKERLQRLWRALPERLRQRMPIPMAILTVLRFMLDLFVKPSAFRSLKLIKSNMVA